METVLQEVEDFLSQEAVQVEHQLRVLAAGALTELPELQLTVEHDVAR